MKKLLLLFCLVTLVAQPAFARNFTPKECPIVGNTKTETYYLPTSKNYKMMLMDDKKADNRNCFKTEQYAKDSGYHKAGTKKH